MPRFDLRRIGVLGPTTLRLVLQLFGTLCVVAGVIGLFVPLWPTTIFMILALWAFARSSPRLHNWLLTHPRFGPTLQAWERHGAIPAWAKLLAVASLGASLALVVVAVHSRVVIGIVAAFFAILILYILTRPNAAPDNKI
ncbi:YbaN family protein [Inquilinus sp. Marseille-Q2685]|uniref:YbaN family protein n=1 Tax=Inquilinus sp. Marseille-Q2685 TaxID=2866581 RepID=UPI001CE3C077|nr:YbaN family protein [Inquilinus sp. Marseille-Q2685]